MFAALLIVFFSFHSDNQSFEIITHSIACFMCCSNSDTNALHSLSYSPFQLKAKFFFFSTAYILHRLEDIHSTEISTGPLISQELSFLWIREKKTCIGKICINWEATWSRLTRRTEIFCRCPSSLGVLQKWFLNGSHIWRCYTFQVQKHSSRSSAAMALESAMLPAFLSVSEGNVSSSL